MRLCVSNGGVPGIEDLCARAMRMEKGADLVVEFAGTNDFACGVPLGEAKDISNDTFYGGCNYLIQCLRIMYPNARLLFVTPIRRLWDGLESKYHEEQRLPLSSYVDVMKETASRNNIPMADLFAESRFAPQEPHCKSDYTVDGTHPNDMGHAVILKK